MSKKEQQEEKKMGITMEEKGDTVEVNITVDLDKKEKRLTITNFFQKLLKTYRGRGMKLVINFSEEQ